MTRSVGSSWRAGALAALALAAILVGCSGEEGGPGVYAARGTVEDVDVEGAQVLIDHEDVPGLMPAMTMNFAVPDADVLDRLAAGQVIEFEMRFTGRSYEVESFEVIGEAPFEDGWRRLGDALVRTSPVPAFDLIDQAGRRVTDADLGDRIGLVDFVYTECPGPCPIQTSNLVALQKSIPEAVRERIRFLSFSLDPEVDRPEVLERYARERGADLATWSFLTGETEALAQLVRAWGVGTLRQPDGTIDHTLILFAVKDGRVMERYTLEDLRSGALLEALVTLAERPPLPAPSPSEPAPGPSPPASAPSPPASAGAGSAPAAMDMDAGHAHGAHGG
ncbi:MAG: SCO family protein [Myxococcota bacterium]